MAMTDELPKKPRFKKREKVSFSERFIPLKTDSGKVIIGKIIVIISVLTLIVCGVVLGAYFYGVFEANVINGRLSGIYGELKADGNKGGYAPPKGDGVSAEVGEEEKIHREPLVLSGEAIQMMEINGDYAGYMLIPGCLEEVFVQRDNEYYLNRNFYEQKRAVGTVFADFRCVVNDYDVSDNIILYGHNNRDGSMFGNLDYYTWDRKYWLKNPFIWFDTRYEQQVYVIISSFIVNTEPSHDNGYVFDYQNYIDFSDDGDYTYERFISEITVRSQIITGIDVNKDDKFITLSTCSYEWEPSRHVIIARKLRAGETTENMDLTGFSVNPNPKWPAVYYSYNGGSYSG